MAVGAIRDRHTIMIYQHLIQWIPIELEVNVRLRLRHTLPTLPQKIRRIGGR